MYKELILIQGSLLCKHKFVKKYFLPEMSFCQSLGFEDPFVACKYTVWLNYSFDKTYTTVVFD